MKSAPLSSQNIIRISRLMTMGLKSGRDWVSVLSWIAESDLKISVRTYLSSWIRKLKLDSDENTLCDERDKSKDLLWRLFFEILLQAHRGSAQLSKLFQNFSEMGTQLLQLKKKEKSLLFVPRFQAWVSLAISVGFTLGLPQLASGLFPTFLTLGRSDLFLAGVGLVVIGFILLHWICALPEKTLAPKLSYTLFLYLLSVHLESGLDFVSSWQRAVNSVDLPPKIKMKFLKSGTNVDTLENFLKALASDLEDPWPEIFTGILWAKASGGSLSKYLMEVADSENKILLADWEDQIRKLTLTSLLPLGLFVFPATLFLLVGPQFLELMTDL